MNHFLATPPASSLPAVEALAAVAVPPAAHRAPRIGAATFDAVRSVNRHHAERHAANRRSQPPPEAAR